MQHAFRPRQHALRLALAALATGLTAAAVAQTSTVVEEIQVSARRRTELAQDVPIPVSVVSGAIVADTGGFNVNRIKELIPSLQLYSSNPRNTALSIRGLGTTFGLTNDGIDPGVGFYVDGVYYARPASSTLDFIDIERIEVLRGPQGTLYGKNTTAGSFNVTTRKPEFDPSANFEFNTGNYDFVQTKGSITGPLGESVAGRFGFSVTQRDGLLTHAATGDDVNTLDNKSWRGQLLWDVNDRIEVLFSVDDSRQNPNGFAQVFAGSVQTQRAPYRQFEAIIADLNYQPASRNPFDRVIDSDTPWRSGNELGGASLNVDIELGSGTLTSTTAWRYWNWDPSNDRDFLGLPALTLSQAPSSHEQTSQEFRWSGDFSDNLSGVFGVFAIEQEVRADPTHREEVGPAQWRFAQNNTNTTLWQTPGLFDGLGINSYPSLDTRSIAAYGQLEWRVSERLRVLPGLRFNKDEKEVDFRRVASGGLETSDPALLALKNGIYSDQSFQADIEDDNVTGQLTVAYDVSDNINAFATYSTGFKPVGLNLGGLPSAGGRVLTELAVVRPEEVKHYEIGLKTRPLPNSTLNFVAYRTDIDDYQAQVQTPDPAVNRGYLANAEEVRVQGLEIDGTLTLASVSLFASFAYTDGEYIKFTNAPLPLEETGGPVPFKDVSGGRLPGISRQAASAGAEYSRPVTLFGNNGEFFVGGDAYYRSDFSSSPSPSRFLNVDSYTVFNARLGFRADQSWSAFLWSRNLADEEYFEQLLPASGSAGHYAAVLGDPRTWGATVRYSF
jgi:iron complex outermembrane receptor protein